MFKKGDRVHMHDGSVWVAKRDGAVPKGRRARRSGPVAAVRGFVRGALVDCLSGDVQMGDYHENVITTWGHGIVVKNFVGIAAGATSNVNNSAAANITDLGLARFWGIGYHTEASSNFSTMTALQTEWAVHSSGGVSRATVSAGSQVLSGTSSLGQTLQYASTQISHAQTVNAIAQHSNSSVGAGTALSIATFASSTKGTTQALNITYNWVFST